MKKLVIALVTALAFTSAATADTYICTGKDHKTHRLKLNLDEGASILSFDNVQFENIKPEECGFLAVTADRRENDITTSVEWCSTNGAYSSITVTEPSGKTEYGCKIWVAAVQRNLDPYTALALQVVKESVSPDMVELDELDPRPFAACFRQQGLSQRDLQQATTKQKNERTSTRITRCFDKLIGR